MKTTILVKGPASLAWELARKFGLNPQRVNWLRREYGAEVSIECAPEMGRDELHRALASWFCDSECFSGPPYVNGTLLHYRVDGGNRTLARAA